jgi:general stress protein YciG
MQLKRTVLNALMRSEGKTYDAIADDIVTAIQSKLGKSGSAAQKRKHASKLSEWGKKGGRPSEKNKLTTAPETP